MFARITIHSSWKYSKRPKIALTHIFENSREKKRVVFDSYDNLSEINQYFQHFPTEVTKNVVICMGVVLVWEGGIWNEVGGIHISCSSSIKTTERVRYYSPSAWINQKGKVI